MALGRPTAPAAEAEALGNHVLRHCLLLLFSLSLSLLKKEKLIPHHSEGWEVQDQGAG